jgi:PAS domain S-box-containing protein
MENAGLFKDLVESSDSIVIVTDPAFNIEYISPAVFTLFHISPATLLKRNIFEFVHADRIQQWKECLEQRSESFSDEISLTLPGQPKAYFDVHVSPIPRAAEKPALALYLHNVTSRKIKEYELVRANQQLDQVIYKTTHDLKAPLKSALGLVTLAEKSDDEEQSRYISMIRKSLLKLDGLIEEMNNFFRNDKLAIRREVIDLRKLVTDELEQLADANTNIHIDLEFSGDIEFYSDSIRVQTILTNILSNAIKYSDPKKSEPFIKISVSIKEEFCQIRIVDNGIGIDQKYLDKIFDLFFRATEHAQGTGLGLFIVKDTIVKLKGTIEVVSTLDEGTTFMISIPNQICQPELVE